jgi:hypothetical protein
MSEIRKVKTRIDPKIWEETLTELGYTIYRNINIPGYSTQHIIGDIVINVEGLGIGIKDREIIYDNWRGICDRHLQKIIPSYYEKLLKKGGVYSSIQAKHNNKRWVYILR